MKYFKRYEEKLLEKIDRDSDIDLLGLLTPLFKSVGRSNAIRKLRNIADSFDKYLTITYKQYLSNKKLNIPKSKIVDFNYSDLNKSLDVKPVQKGSNEVIIDIEDDKMKDLVDDGHINNSVEDSREDSREDSKDGIEGTSGFVDKDDSKDDSNIETEKTKKEEPIKEEPIKKIDPSDTPLSDFDEEEDMDEYINDMSNQERKEEYGKLVRQRSYTITNLKNLQRQYDTANKTYHTYKGGIQKQKAGRKLPNLEKKINKAKELLVNLNFEIGEFEKRYPELKIVNERREIKEWEEFETEEVAEWSEEDKLNLTSNINPYKIKEFLLKADIIMDNSGDHKEKLSKDWEILKNEIYKKWYFTYDTSLLEVGYKKAKKEFDKRPKSEQKQIKKSMSVGLALKEKYGKSITNYSSPYFIGLKNVTKNYFIINIDNNLYLLNRLFFDNGKFAFKIIGDITIKEDMTFIVENLLNTNEKNMEINFRNRKLTLYKEERDFPVLIVKNSYITTLPVSNKKDKDWIDLVQINLSALDEKDSDDILNNFKYYDLEHKDLTDEQIEYIKKLKR